MFGIDINIWKWHSGIADNFGQRTYCAFERSGGDIGLTSAAVTHEVSISIADKQRSQCLKFAPEAAGKPAQGMVITRHLVCDSLIADGNPSIGVPELLALWHHFFS